MKFSIIIPTWNNLKYLKICLNSIKKNSKYQHDLNVHVSEGTDGTIEYLTNNAIKFNHSVENLGLCKGANSAASLAETDYIVYTHDDMYLLPDWDFFLSEEINKIKTNLYYFSGTMMGPKGCGFVEFNCGTIADEFDEAKLLNNYHNYNYYDHQGTHWAPHLIHKTIWDKIGGFSKEFDPGFASDTDLNMKLWTAGVRIFKGINNCKVYHFGSMSMRKRKELVRNKGNRFFLRKWGVSSDLFLKFYLNSRKPYTGPLADKPVVSIRYFIEFIRCKIKLFFAKIINLQ